MDTIRSRYDQLLCVGAKRLTGHQRRLFQAQVCLVLCDGNPRRAERRFGWGRQTVQKGLHEWQTGVRYLENFKARGARRSEDRECPLGAVVHLTEVRHHDSAEEAKRQVIYFVPLA